VRLSLILVLALIPFANAFAEAQTSNNPLDDLVDAIINTMTPIFNLVFNLQNNERLEQWGESVIQKQVEITEKQVTNQLGYDPQVTCC
jgi:hypothetical protein